MEENRHRLSEYLPNQVELPEELKTRYSDRRFSWPFAICVALSFGVGAFLRFGSEYSDIGFKIAMAIAVVITVVVLAPTEMTFPSEKPNLSRRENNNDDAG